MHSVILKNHIKHVLRMLKNVYAQTIVISIIIITIFIIITIHYLLLLTKINIKQYDGFKFQKLFS